MMKEAYSEAVARGTRFLREQVRSGDYSLSCYGSDGNPRITHNQGHLFSAFFIAEAIAEDLDEVERTVLLVRHFSQRLNGLWGYGSRAYYRGGWEHRKHLVDADGSAFAMRTLRKLGVYLSVRKLMRFYRLRGLWFWLGLANRSGFSTFASYSRLGLVVERTFPN
ncbi:MAG: hypothetical protein ABGX16_02370, partial [Pirellulales bacterium]